MTKEHRYSQREIPRHVQRQKSRGKIIQVAVMGIIGLLLVSLGAFLVWNSSAGQIFLDYSPQDVSRENPLHAIHEMDPPSLDSIPFIPKDSPQPRIEIQKTFHNFGSIDPEEVVEQEFVIFNAGEGPLTISRAYTTCGCTTANFTSTVIPPGKVSIMTLRFDAGYHDTRGQSVRRGVIIENNDPNNPQMEIWAEASVRTK